MNKQKGFSAVEGLLIIIFIGIVGFGGWYVWSQNNDDPKGNSTIQDNEQSDISTFEECAAAGYPIKESYPVQCTVPGKKTFWKQIDGVGTQTDEAEESTAPVPDKWTEYTNSELKVSFSYPDSWGAPQASEFDQSMSYQYFKFSDNDNVYFGAPEPDYSTEGRGGSMTDYSGFKEESGSFMARTLTEGYDIELKDYKRISDSDPGIVNYDVTFFEKKVYHALFNTTGATTGLNFVGDAAKVSESDFRKFVESVDVN